MDEFIYALLLTGSAMVVALLFRMLRQTARSQPVDENEALERAKDRIIQIERRGN
jgi:hypothetical protein